MQGRKVRQRTWLSGWESGSPACQPNQRRSTAASSLQRSVHAQQASPPCGKQAAHPQVSPREIRARGQRAKQRHALQVGAPAAIGRPADGAVGLGRWQWQWQSGTMAGNGSGYLGEAHSGAPHCTRCAPSHHPPHFGAAQVGLGVAVLAQVLAAQVLERIAGGRACGPARCNVWGRSAARTWLRPMDAARCCCLDACCCCYVRCLPPSSLTAAAGDCERRGRGQQQRGGGSGAQQCGAGRLPQALWRRGALHPAAHPPPAAALLLEALQERGGGSRGVVELRASGGGAGGGRHGAQSGQHLGRWSAQRGRHGCSAALQRQREGLGLLALRMLPAVPLVSHDRSAGVEGGQRSPTDWPPAQPRQMRGVSQLASALQQCRQPVRTTPMCCRGQQ